MRLPSIQSVASDLLGYIPDEEQTIELLVVVKDPNDPQKRSDRFDRIAKALGLKWDDITYNDEAGTVDVLFHIGFGEVGRCEKFLDGKSCPKYVESYDINEDQKSEAEEVYGLDVRLQVLEDGDWSLHTGDAQYDDDHRGSWGVGTLVPGMTKGAVRELAAELISEAASG